MSTSPTDALCAQIDPELWFPVQGDAWARLRVPALVREVCAACPVRDACLAYALDTRQGWGVWGGLDPAERADVLRHVPAA